MNVRVSNLDAEESGAYVVPFSVQSMITQTDKSGRQIKLASSVSFCHHPLLLSLSSLFRFTLFVTSDLSVFEFYTNVPEDDLNRMIIHAKSALYL